MVLVSAHPTNATPRVTVIVTQRERFSLSERSLESVLADRSIPFRLIYVDAGAPAHIAAYLERRSREAGFELLRFEGPMWPTHGRIAALGTVTSEYVLFMDNDGLLEPGSIAAMVACADEHHAGIVGPLYLWSDGQSPPRVHMAGGELRIATRPEGRALFELHTLLDADLSAMDGRTRPEPCDFLEYHCVLARTDLVRGPDGLDPGIVCVHEHIDLTFLARRRGLGIFMEPRARVDYIAFADYHLYDLPYFDWRWRPDAVEASLAAFSRKWDLLMDAEAYSGIRGFTRKHVAGTALVAAGDMADGIGAEALAPAQSLGILVRQLARLGYPSRGLGMVAAAHTLAMRLFDGSYRPCGRPFLNHGVGTASVLAHFRLRPDVVVAGLLHAAYSHGRLGGDDGDEGDPPTEEALGRHLPGRFGRQVLRHVAAYHAWQQDPVAALAARPDPAHLTTNEAVPVAIAIANAIEELASREIAISARRAGIPADRLDYFVRAAAAMGAPAMGRTLVRLLAEAATDAVDLRLPTAQSFRLHRGRKLPAAHPAS